MSCDQILLTKENLSCKYTKNICMYLNYRKINGESDCMEDRKKYTQKNTV